MSTAHPTNDQTCAGIYEALENLPSVEPDPRAVELVERLAEAARALHPMLSEAKALLEDHEAAAERIVTRLRERVPIDTGIGDQTYELIDVLSGTRALNIAMSTLRDLCDPDQPMPSAALIARDGGDQGEGR